MKANKCYLTVASELHFNAIDVFNVVRVAVGCLASSHVHGQIRMCELAFVS